MDWSLSLVDEDCKEKPILCRLIDSCVDLVKASNEPCFDLDHSLVSKRNRVGAGGGDAHCDADVADAADAIDVTTDASVIDVVKSKVDEGIFKCIEMVEKEYNSSRDLNADEAVSLVFDKIALEVQTGFNSHHYCATAPVSQVALSSRHFSMDVPIVKIKKLDVGCNDAAVCSSGSDTCASLKHKRECLGYDGVSGINVAANSSSVTLEADKGAKFPLASAKSPLLSRSKKCMEEYAMAGGISPTCLVLGTSDVVTRNSNCNVAAVRPPQVLAYEIDPTQYKQHLDGRPQQRWWKFIDNFTDAFICRLPHKWHPIVPSVVIASPKTAHCGNSTSAKGKGVASAGGNAQGSRRCDSPSFKKFVPKLYPLEAERQNGHKQRPRVLHPYAAELGALEWTNTVTGHSHRGPHLLGGGTLLDINASMNLQSYPIANFVMVDTLEGLEAMISELARHSIIAIDVEHSQYSYRGFVCLVQLSSRDRDWLVDPFCFFEHMHLLNEVTTDPGILKILHGCGNDVVWLQRDFGVYLVNVFDTNVAAAVTMVPSRHALGPLLGHVLQVRIKKAHSVSDWRIRPLKEGMLKYACEDTHYLLSLYERLKNRALCMESQEGKSFQRVIEIMQRSRDLCLAVYVPSRQKSPSLSSLCKNGLTSPLQINMAHNLFDFRDYAAKVLDMCDSSIASDHNIFTIARSAELGIPLEKFTEVCKTHLKLLVKELPYIVQLKEVISAALLLNPGEIKEPTCIANILAH